MLPAYRALVCALPLAFVLFAATSLWSSSDLDFAELHAILSSAYLLQFGNGETRQLREADQPLWTEQENKLRSYRWQAPEVDQSLQAVVVGLDEVNHCSKLHLKAGGPRLTHPSILAPQSERRTRNWLLKSRPAAQRGVGVGLGAGASNFWLPHAPTTPRQRGLPKAYEGPGWFKEGSSYVK